jgi:hypothetical protein
MPIYEDKITHAEMVKFAGTHVCGECGGVLGVGWSADHNCYMLRCNHLEHDSIIEVDLTAHYQELNSKFGRRNKKLAAEIGTSKEIALRKYEYLPRLNKEEATEVVETIWPGASPISKKKAIMICYQYGLNPLMKHVYILTFKRRDKAGNVIGSTDEVVLGIQATRQITAQTAGKYSYMDGTPRVMTQKEQEEIMGEYNPNMIWCITKIKDAQHNVYPGYGNWPKGAPVQGAEKGNTPFNMACIRSERQALDKYKPGAIPPDVGVMDEQYADRQAVTVTVEDKQPERTVDAQTGEIVEGESQEVTEATQDKDFDAMQGNGGEKVEPAPTTAPPVKAEPKPEPSTYEQQSHLDDLRTNYHLNLKSYAKAAGITISKLEDLTKDQADTLTQAVEADLKKKGVL